jgi:class 3 adenylate cyclase/HAMP domain-containing protein
MAACLGRRRIPSNKRSKPRRFPVFGITRRMTLKKRLSLGFIAINLLFSANIAFFTWSNNRRKTTVEDHRQAITGEKIIAGVQQKLINIQKQIALLSEAVVENSNGARSEDVAQFKGQLEAIRKEIEQLRSSSTGEVRSRVDALSKGYAELSASWIVFYENFGVHHAKAIMEMVMVTEPLSRRMLDQVVPAVLEAERRHVEAATLNFDEVARMTDTASFVMFSLSGILAITISSRLSSYIRGLLVELKNGAALIGSGQLDHKIEIHSKDELGDLARSFNEMADHLLAAQFELKGAHAELVARHEEVEKQRQLSDGLLLNILPEQVATELRLNDSVEPKYFEDVTILFTDFVGFTLSTEKLAAEDLVSRLHDYFTAFDEITSRYGVEKLKTIGDSYMCVSGMPGRTPSHPVDMVMAAMEMVEVVKDLGSRPGYPNWRVRIGIHTGPVIAGVVGIKKFAFDIWGDSVNYSSRMESSGAPNRINISERTQSRIKDFFSVEDRGKVGTKDKRDVEMYFVNGILPELLDAQTPTPPPAFLRRYRIYFQKVPPAFPSFLLAPPVQAIAGPVPEAEPLLLAAIEPTAVETTPV